MLKKLIVAAALVAPSMAFAAPFDALDFVIRIGTSAVSQQGNRGYDDHNAYSRGGYEQQRMRNVIDQEQTRQRDRIVRNQREGDLTRAEANRVNAEQLQIRRLEQQYLADNHLSQREFDRLQDELRQSARHLESEVTDSQDRGRDYDRYSRR